MHFKFHIGTKVLFGKGCVKENKDQFAKYGKKAFIVTGRGAGRKSGALDDVVDALKELEIDYRIYDKIENNPSPERVKDGGVAAAKFKADFIIGIGGGSPLDAAKAVAVLAVNDIEPLELYKNVFTYKPLPVIAIPTIAGTGSEITPYSILTRKDLQIKKSFGNEDMFPVIAFLDAGYTESVPHNLMVDTVLDALSHAVEGFLSKRSTPVSDLFAIESIRLFGESMGALQNEEINFDLREKMMYMALLGGMVISHTGTTIVHPIGYTLTYFKDVPHGKANALFLKEYLKFNYEALKDKTERILDALKLGNLEQFGEVMDRLLNGKINLSEEEYDFYSSIAVQQKSVSSNIRTVSKEDILHIMKNSLIRLI